MPLAAVIAVILLFPGSLLIPLVESQASAALGRRVTIGGLHVTLGRSTSIALTGVRIDNPPGFAAEPAFALAERVLVSLALLDSLRRWDPVIQAVMVEGATVEAIRRVDGTDNLPPGIILPVGDEEPGGSDTVAGNGPSRIGALTIRDSRLHLVHAARRADVLVQLTTEAEDGAAATLRATAAGTYAGQRFAAELTGGAILGLRDAAQPWPVELRITDGPTRITLQGTLGDPLALRAADLRLDLAGPDLALLAPLIGVPIPSTPAYRLVGRLGFAAGRLRVTGITGQVGNTDLAGTVTLDPRAARPDVVADLQSRHLDLADIAGLIGGQPGHGTPLRPDAATTGRLLPDTPIDIPQIEAADIHLHYRAAQVSGRDSPLDAIDVTAELVGGVLTLRPLRIGVGRGHIEGGLVLTPQSGGEVRVVAELLFRRLDLARLLRAAGSSGAGALDGRASIDAVGRSTAQLLARGNGALSVSTSGGSLSAFAADLAGLRLGSAALAALGLPARTTIECFVADFALQGGRLNTRALYLETTEALITGTGAIRLDEESLDLRLHSESRHLTVATVPLGIRIGGHFRDPSVFPLIEELGTPGGIAHALGLTDFPLAILPTVQWGIGDDPRCAAMLERLRGAPPARGPRRPRR